MKIRALGLAAMLAAGVLAHPAFAADAAATAASAPSARQLAALCADCALVSGTVVEKRKGKTSGVGAVGGAVAGGVVGNQVGDSTVATVGGAVVGGLVGNAIEKRMKRHKVWVTTVTMKDGSQRKFEQESDPGLRAGDVVHVEGGQLRRR